MSQAISLVEGGSFALHLQEADAPDCVERLYKNILGPHNEWLCQPILPHLLAEAVARTYSSSASSWKWWNHFVTLSLSKMNGCNFYIPGVYQDIICVCQNCPAEKFGKDTKCSFKALTLQAFLTLHRLIQPKLRTEKSEVSICSLQAPAVRANNSSC